MVQKILLVCLLLGSTASGLLGQTGESALDHIRYLNEREEMLSKSYLSYMSAVAHSGRARKMEKRRMDLINSIKESIRDASKLKPFQGDASLKNAFIDYWNILLSIFNEDYHKIVDMEEVAEQSYDLMEAYILAQEKVDQKLQQAHDKLMEVYHAFGENHNIHFTENESKLSKKVKQTADVNAYYNKLFLVYFKAAVQEVYLLDALQHKDLNAIEQSRNSLTRFSDEALQRLDTLKPFHGDGSLISSTRKVLEYYKKEANSDVPVMTDYFIKEDEFNKIRKTYEARQGSNRSQADVDAYNKAVNDINKAIASYNKATESTNKTREAVVTALDNAKNIFMDRHVP